MSDDAEQGLIDLRTDLKQYPDDFEKLFYLIQPQQENMANAEEFIQKNEFFRWLNKEGSSFSIAKKKMVKKELILPNDFFPQNHADFANKYPLEYMCTCIVHYFCEREYILRQVPALKIRHDKVITAMKFIQEELSTLGTALGCPKPL